MISPLVFSRDRPAQLDLLLRSLEANASTLVSSPVVLYRATTGDYARGYELCFTEHRRTRFILESGNFETQTRRLIATASAGDHAMFLVDDDVLYMDVSYLGPDPRGILDAHPEILCFSLRLGFNTTRCFPHGGEEQGLPVTRPIGPVIAWEWKGAEGDFGYPASLDGHVFRTADVGEALAGRSFANPNQLEDALVSGLADSERVWMASYGLSALVGIPANRVNRTHGNRTSAEFPFEPEALNRSYLAGLRLSMRSVKPALVNGAHSDLQLEWESPRSEIGKKIGAPSGA